MKTRLQRFYTYLFLCALPLWTMAQGHFVAKAPKTIPQDEILSIEFSVDNARITNFVAPNFDGFTVVSGPNVSQTFSNINGNVQRTTSYGFLLKPKKTGRFRIGAAKAEIDGSPQQTQILNVEVVPGTGRVTTPSTPSSTLPKTVGERDLYFRAEANRRRVYEQEAIVVDYKVYNKSNFPVNNIKLKAKGDFTDFWTQELPRKNTIEIGLQKKGDDWYQVGTYTSYILFPQKTGKLSLPALDFVCDVTTSAEDVWSINLGDISTEEVARSSNTLDFEVQPLPTPRPEGFTGLVGSFAAKRMLLSKQLHVNEIDTLRIVLTGKGNHKYAAAPTLIVPNGVKLYPVKITDKTEMGHDGISGNVYYDYPFSVTKAGETVLPEMEMVYFDLNTQKYRSQQLPSLTLKVEPSQTATPTNADEKQERKEQVKGEMGEASDIGGILLRVVAYLAVLVAAFFALRWGIRQWRKHQDTAQQRQRKAGTRALSALQKLDTTQATFYDQTAALLLAYFSEKWQWKSNTFTQQAVYTALAERGVSLTTQEQVQQCFAQCDRARFAPQTDETEKTQFQQKLCQLITELEQQLG